MLIVIFLFSAIILAQEDSKKYQMRLSVECEKEGDSHKVKITGTAYGKPTFEDGIIFSLTVNRLINTIDESSNEIKQMEEQKTEQLLVQLKDKKFTREEKLDAIGFYKLNVVFDPYRQTNPNLRDEMEGDLRQHNFQYDFTVGGVREILKQLAQDFINFDKEVTKVLNLIEKTEQAVSDNEKWKKEGGGLRNETQQLHDELSKIKSTFLLTASVESLSTVLISLGHFLRMYYEAKETRNITDPREYWKKEFIDRFKSKNSNNNDLSQLRKNINDKEVDVVLREYLLWLLVESNQCYKNLTNAYQTKTDFEKKCEIAKYEMGKIKSSHQDKDMKRGSKKEKYEKLIVIEQKEDRLEFENLFKNFDKLAELYTTAIKTVKPDKEAIEKTKAEWTNLWSAFDEKARKGK